MYSLYSWGALPGSEGLCSFDPSCLSVQAYLQLSNSDWVLRQVNNTNISPTGCLPVLTAPGPAVESGLWRIIEFLKSEGHDLDAGLDKEQAAQATALVSMVRDGLVDALLFSWYLVPENFAQAIRPQLAKLFGFPLSLAIPTQLRDHAEQRLRANGTVDEADDSGSEDTNDDSQPGSLRSRLPRIYLLAKTGFNRHKDRSSHPVYRQADEYLAVLSRKLSTKQYFFGDKATTLDAVVYGHLSLLLRLDLPQNPLKTAISQKYPNLRALCDRVHSRLEKPTAISEPSLVAGTLSVAKQWLSSYTALPALPLGDAAEDPKRAEKIRSATGALFVFLGYVIYNGILSAPATSHSA
ncbi:hypothetical protein GGF46_002566 [Coemansia sp. RSA 552]|nr:hypothetical protein GGF46_002566 [Coemansia sp. RSA 552]